MKDLTVEVDGALLNCRAAGIIIHEGKVLFHRNTADVYYALIGGRVQICESSDNAVKREIKEELGKDVEITGYIATIENFFNGKGKDYHEILFVHKAEFVDDDDKKITKTLQNIEGDTEKNVQYEWLDISKFDEYDIRPSVIKDVIKNEQFPTHVINKGK